MVVLFKYCADVENCESFRGFGFYFLFFIIYIYRLEKYGRNSKFVFFSLGNFSPLFSLLLERGGKT